MDRGVCVGREHLHNADAEFNKPSITMICNISGSIGELPRSLTSDPATWYCGTSVGALSILLTQRHLNVRNEEVR